MQKIPLPTGIDDFKEIVKNYYYIDKTSLIEQVLENGSKVSLFTRPRRFGKSLNMSMLQYYFEDKTEQQIAEEENATQQSVHIILERALENLKKYLKIKI